ncbi:MAG: GxxExxY protein [Deltaproteobacteria bacterium]|nr:GxxExxY protein [Deltaproteobacteria bacterium]
MADPEFADVNELTELVIGAALDVHRALGPGLLEATYEECLAAELGERNVRCSRQVPVPLHYKARRLDCVYRADLLVDFRVVVEVKSVERVLPLHEAQLLTYLRLGGWRVGLLFNFNVPVLRDGILRVVASEEWAPPIPPA